MRRREAPPTAEQLPPHLATFDPADWPEESEWVEWAEFPPGSYARMLWNRARSKWLREHRAGSK